MVLIPEGEFWMGSDSSEVLRVLRECRRADTDEERCQGRAHRETPRHRVHLDAFYIDRHEVTTAQFEAFVRVRGYRTTAEREGWGRVRQDNDGQRRWEKIDGAAWHAPGGPGTTAAPDHPVVQVSWIDADAYCRWAGKRLPTEAEWEKAARGTDGRRYPWGEDWAPSHANGAMSVRTTRPVGAYPDGASPYGVHDMAGNVAEWVADWFDEHYYMNSPDRNPTGPSSGRYKIRRGGAWPNAPFVLRSPHRLDPLMPGARYDYTGFRCARDAPR
jgi:formylglycine-generating enzyme required for sulfatase activity